MVTATDETHLTVAPFFVGDVDAPRFVLPGNFPHGNSGRMYLAELRQRGAPRRRGAPGPTC